MAAATAGAVILVIAIVAIGVVATQKLATTGSARFVLQSTQGVDPCNFPSQFWNGGSGTDVEWELPANRVPASSCSFTVTFKNVGSAGAGHVTFAARYGPEYKDPQGYWHVRFIKDATVNCPTEIPNTQPGAGVKVSCSLSAPDLHEYLGAYTYVVS